MNPNSTSPSAGTAYDGIVERTPEGGVIRFERRLLHPIEHVWDAITSPARLAEWWLPFPADITVDLREGGRMVMVANHDESIRIDCTILRLDPPRLLEHTHVDEGAVMRWELEPAGPGCVLRLSHFVVDPAAAIGQCFVVGLHTSLSRLEPCLHGTPTEWDWDEFAESQRHYATMGLAPSLDA